MAFMQCAVGMIYPDQRVLCSKFVDDHGALCGAFWRDIPFQTGHSCDLCGDADGAADSCDDCLKRERPLKNGPCGIGISRCRSRVVLGFMHEDQIDLVAIAGHWVARAGADILTQDTFWFLCRFSGAVS